jgi:hypothetical protein
MADGADYCKPNTAATSTCRQREYLAEKEIERLIEAARKRGRNAPHDAAAIPLARIGTAACARALLRREDAVCAIRVPPQLGEMQIFECKPCGLVVATEALRSSVQPLLERRYYY